jgi:orotidine-5'-phosphate decarboxylase
MDFDRSVQSGINPGIASAAAGKDEGMNRPAAVDDGQTHIAVGRDVRERMDPMPHAASRAREAGIRFDPAQIRG